MTAAVFEMPKARIVELEDDKRPTNLPEEFWSTRPLFEQIRQGAWSRLLSADAVFGAVLVRAAFMIDHRILLPPVVGRYGSLNLMAGIVGESGTGKGSSADAAEELLGTPHNLGYRTTEVTAGSGEGVIRSFSELVQSEEGGGKKTNEYRQVFDGVFIRVDEGEVLGQLGSRNGSTLWPIWRSGWSGEKLGFTNASRERRLPTVRAHTYRLCALIGIQPTLAGEILADSDGGTPQRFLWMSTTDPALPATDVLWPGQLGWKPPRWDWPDSALRPVLGQRLRLLEVDPAIVRELQSAQRAKVIGEATVGLDSHRGLNRLKVAAVLAVLDNRLAVRPDDWALAAMVLDTSDAVREATRAVIRRHSAEQEEHRIGFYGRKAAAEETAKRGASATVDRVAQLVRNYVERQTAKSGQGVKRKDVRDALGSRNRDSLDAALAVAMDRLWIVEIAGSYWPNNPEEQF